MRWSYVTWQFNLAWISDCTGLSSANRWHDLLQSKALLIICYRSNQRPHWPELSQCSCWTQLLFCRGTLIYLGSWCLLDARCPIWSCGITRVRKRIQRRLFVIRKAYVTSRQLISLNGDLIRPAVGLNQSVHLQRTKSGKVECRECHIWSFVLLKHFNFCYYNTYTKVFAVRPHGILTSHMHLEV
jgi:hypothetical protein